MPVAEKAAVEVVTPDVTEIRPLERRVDTVLRIQSPEDDFVLAIEAQGRRDPAKAASWTYYLAHLQAKYRRPALLLVVCRDQATAEWAAGPFRCGVNDWTALSTHPLVIGPGNVPVIVDWDEAAQNPTLAAFCALLHGPNGDEDPILEALAHAMGSLDQDDRTYFIQMLDIGLGDTLARHTWRQLMRNYFPGQGTIVEEYYLEGKAEGKAEGEAAGKAKALTESILHLLERRGISVSASARLLITSCTDLDTLNRWFDRAITTTNAENLFAEDQLKPTEQP
ncbi:hypothetical protein [Streptantibioticus ferralitis]|uniref:hypothetical protein n=1 Tax=Streptantibioticus ferralitis TaxID=236510 RepID=UPI0027E2960C|nr:hypothetical protein [Streptantibioticus ferralitis]